MEVDYANIDEMLDTLWPTPKVVVPRRMRDIRFLERRRLGRLSGANTDDDICSYCDLPSAKEFCSKECERSAAMAGLPLTFPKD